MSKINYHDWSKYFPHEIQSREYASFIDIAAFKITDIYTAFCYFNFSLDFYKSDNLGEFSINSNEEYRLFLKSMFVYNSLFYINSCKDYIMQMLYCFCQNHSEETYDHEVLEKTLDKEDLTNLVNEKLEFLFSLSNGSERDRFENILKLKKKLENYFNTKYIITKKLNYIKHRGMYHIPGLGQNNKIAYEDLGIKVTFIPIDKEPYICVPKKQIFREEIDIEKTFLDLIEFKNLFIEDFNALIKLTIPDDYCIKSGGIEYLLKNFDIPEKAENKDDNN